MKYKMTFFNKIYLFFHERYEDRIEYLIPILEEHYNNFFNSIQIRKPYHYEEFIIKNAELLIFEYENIYY